jgi:hypothetical protein
MRRGKLSVHRFVPTVLVAGGLLFAASLTGTASADSIPTPTGIDVAAATDTSGLGGAVPAVLATPGSPVTLTITLTPAGAAFTNDTTLNLTASLASGSRASGSVSPASVVMLARANSAQFGVSYSAVDNGVQITAAISAPKGKQTGVTPGTTQAFDVLKTLEGVSPTDPALQTGLGVGNADCMQSTTESECGTLVLSHGFSSQRGALSLGACTPDLGCTSGSEVVQFIADLGTAYSPSDPALMIFRCDKKQCPGKGVNTYTIKVSFSASGPLNLVSAPCVNKGVALDAAGNTFCTDYVQSHRDNSGDALLYFLFTQDMRGAT